MVIQFLGPSGKSRGHIPSNMWFWYILVITCFVYEKQQTENSMTLIWPSMKVLGSLMQSKTLYMTPGIWLCIYRHLWEGFPPLNITFWIIQSDASWSILFPNKLFTTIKNKYPTVSDKIGKNSQIWTFGPVERFNWIHILAVHWEASFLNRKICL